MENNPEKEKSAFTARFKHFLTTHNLNTNSLAVQLTPSGDEKEIKNKRVNIGRWASGKVSPSYDGIVEIATKYDIDMNWFMLGEGEMKRDADAIAKKKDNTDWQTLYLNERNEVFRLMKANERLSVGLMERAGLLTDQEGSKIESDGHTTEDCAYTPAKIGYVQEYMIKLSEKQIEKAATQLEGMEAFCQRVMIEARQRVSMQ